ncbi:MAG: hypothetical protein JXK93_09095 [Sphaerochaetaceae bacterium]|nr:hypothetical protein [Sphaerochaetaceae bacterium]
MTDHSITGHRTEKPSGKKGVSGGLEGNLNVEAMRRTIDTAFDIWKRKNFLWPLSIALSYAGCRIFNAPRGLIVEASTGCTGYCRGCPEPDKTVDLSVDIFEKVLAGRRFRPVTVHFSGKHSDPLASSVFPELVRAAASRSSMVSVSTIGLGLGESWEYLPVDRWILSIPAATLETWHALRGNSRLDEFRDNLRRLLHADRGMVELVLTLWKPSAGDTEAFHRLADEEGIGRRRVVFGRFDPDGHHLGRIENLALEAPGCPYIIEEGVRLIEEPPGCPLSGTVFLDAEGYLHPCPFTERTQNDYRVVSREKTGRLYEACRYCP